MRNWTFNEDDKEIFLKLQNFIPDKVFDVHAHIYRLNDLKLNKKGFLNEGPSEVSIDVWKANIENQVGAGKTAGGLFFPYPSLYGDVCAQNEFVIEQLKIHSECSGLVFAQPDMKQENAQIYLQSKQIAGFKVYHFFSHNIPRDQASIDSYAPDWLWKLCDLHGAVIMLHLVKDGALADPDNQKQIIKQCSKYPNAKLILAHAGRGFNWYNTQKGLSAVRGLQNVWFDTSAICESGAIKAVLKEFGPQKLMWGSDFPISVIRGKCVTVGNGFVWLQNDTLNWDNSGCRPVLVGMEALRALRDASEDFGLTKEELKDIFYRNAYRLLIKN